MEPSQATIRLIAAVWWLTLGWPFQADHRTLIRIVTPGFAKSSGQRDTAAAVMTAAQTPPLLTGA